MKDSTRPWTETLPKTIDPARRHVFYLHGHIIERTQERRPTHPEYGIYEYDAILRALAADGAVVISAVRPSGVAPPRYADGVERDVKALLDAGVPAERIGVVGFSRGGWIAQLVSARLEAPVRTVLLGWCPSPEQPEHLVRGHVLSIREKNDEIVPPCTPLFEKSGAASTRELVVDVGDRHGTFYRPHEAWMKPLREFLWRGE